MNRSRWGGARSGFAQLGQEGMPAWYSLPGLWDFMRPADMGRCQARGRLRFYRRKSLGNRTEGCEQASPHVSAESMESSWVSEVNR